jgi:hypothetical protein
MGYEIQAALISAAAGLAVGWKEEIKALLAGTSQSKLYEGSWTCDWHYQDTGGNSHVVQDTLGLETKGGARLKGTGSTPGYGDYVLAGRANAHNAYLKYVGKGPHEELIGVVIMKKEAPLKVIGVWCQYLSDGTFRSGTTIWTR